MSLAIQGVKCAACGAVSYPKHLVCPRCRGESFQPVDISGEGTVLSYTDVYALAIDYDVRYLRLAIVELDGGVRATGHLLDAAPKLGKRVRTTVGVVRETDGKLIYGLQFVPA